MPAKHDAKGKFSRVAGSASPKPWHVGGSGTTVPRPNHVGFKAGMRLAQYGASSLSSATVHDAAKAHAEKTPNDYKSWPIHVAQFHLGYSAGKQKSGQDSSLLGNHGHPPGGHGGHGR